MSEFIEEQIVPAEVVIEEAPELPDSHPGVDDGFVDAGGDMVVHEFDKDGKLVGWHKEPAEPNPDDVEVDE